MADRAYRYERLAEQARANPTQARAGYLIAGTFVMLGILDALSTNWALEVGAFEANGFMRYLQEHLGVMWFVPKIMLQALVATMIVWSPNKPTIIIMALTCCWTASVVISNFVIASVLST
jgi:hypothetical protein